MSEEHDDVRRTHGPAPTDGDERSDEELETFLLERDRAEGDADDMTAEGLQRGPTMDERLAEEDRGAGRVTPDLPVLGEVDGPNHEPTLVSDVGLAGTGRPDELATEESAMHLDDEPAGGTDHPDDYLYDDREG
jgi:hypothetical protein